MVRNHRSKVLALGLLFSTAWTASSAWIAHPAEAATPPPKLEAPDLSVLDMGTSAEEHMVSGGDVPATPESGMENPEDLLKSSPMNTAIKPKKAAQAADGLPGKLAPVRSLKAAAPKASELPPLPAAPPASPPPASTVQELAPSATEPLAGSPAAEELPPPVEDTAAVEPAPLEVVDVPAEPEPVAASDDSGTSTKKYDRSIPLYERENPTVGVDIHGSLGALGTPIKSQPAGSATVNESSVRNFGFGFEFEPKFLQSIGVVSIGPSANLYVLDPVGDLTEGSFSIFSVGVSAKYQLKFMRSQYVVPFVGFEAQMIHYNFVPETGIGTGWTLSSGPTFGAMLLMNWMEPSSAHNLFSEYGIKRTYLVGEAKLLKASETILSVEGTAIYFGLRMEY